MEDPIDLLDGELCTRSLIYNHLVVRYGMTMTLSRGRGRGG